MKKIILFFLINLLNVCFAQSLMYHATLKASKTNVSSTETFTVTYTLSGVEGYVYMGVQYGYFESIGTDRWEGKIRRGETKTLTFNVKLKESAKPYIKEIVPLGVGFSYNQFGDKVLGERGYNGETVFIKITDNKQFIPLDKKIIEWNDSLRNKDGSININLNIQPIQLDISKKTFKQTQ